MRNFSMADTQWKNKGHEFDQAAALIEQRKDKIFIYGTQSETEEFCVENDLSIPIQGIFVEGQVSDADITAVSDAIIISCTRERANYDKAAELFGRFGYTENVDFYQGEVFRQLWATYFLNEIRIDRIEIFMTSYCTLNCEKCIAYIPYFKKREHAPLEVLKQDADLLFSKVDYVYKLKLLGGEGLVYPHLAEYIDYLKSKWGGVIGEIRIGTNGTNYPSEELMELCRKYHVIMDVSDYSHAVPDRCKLDDVIRFLQENGVQYDIKRVGEQWLDMGFPENPYQPADDNEVKEHFHKCAMFCRDFYKGKLFYCCSNFAAVQAGLIDENANDYFDFNREFTKKELMEFELGYNPMGHLSLCKKCLGCSDEANNHHVEVAKQKGSR